MAAIFHSYVRECVPTFQGHLRFKIHVELSGTGSVEMNGDGGEDEPTQVAVLRDGFSVVRTVYGSHAYRRSVNMRIQRDSDYDLQGQ